jgi:hypothetical protein
VSSCDDIVRTLDRIGLLLLYKQLSNLFLTSLAPKNAF